MKTPFPFTPKCILLWLHIITWGLLYSPEVAAQSEVEIKPKSLLLACMDKYLDFQNGRYLIEERSFSDYVADTSWHTEEVIYSFSERGALNFPQVHMWRKVKEHDIEWIFHGDTMAYLKKSGFWEYEILPKREWKSMRLSFKQIPFTHPDLFFGEKVIMKAQVQRENEEEWVIETRIKSAYYLLWVNKQDSLLRRVDFFVPKHQYYRRIDILETEFNQPEYDTSSLYIIPDSATLDETIITLKSLEAQILSPGSQAVDWELLNLEGETIRLDDFRGKYVLLDFWYIGCKPCVDAMPHLQEIQEEFGIEKLQVIGVESVHKDPEKIKDFLLKYGIEYSMVYGEGARAKATEYGVVAFPGLFLIDPDGIIVNSYVGFGQGSKRKIQSDVRAAISE